MHYDVLRTVIINISKKKQFVNDERLQEQLQKIMSVPKNNFRKLGTPPGTRPGNKERPQEQL